MRNMDWVDASPVRSTLTSIYWQKPFASITKEEFFLLVEAHPEKFNHPVHPVLRRTGVLGTLFGKLIFEIKCYG